MAATLGNACSPAPARQASNPVLDWNDIARELIVIPALTPVEQTRAMAIVHVAVHDAVNGITGEYQHYKPDPVRRPPGRRLKRRRLPPPTPGAHRNRRQLDASKILLGVA